MDTEATVFNGISTPTTQRPTTTRFMGYIARAKSNEEIALLQDVFLAYAKAGLLGEEESVISVGWNLKRRKHEIVIEHIGRLYPFIRSDELHKLAGATLVYHLAELEAIDWVPSDPDSKILNQAYKHQIALFAELSSCANLGKRANFLINAVNKIYLAGLPIGASKINRKCKSCGYSVARWRRQCTNKFHLKFARHSEYYMTKANRGTANADERRLAELLLTKRSTVFCVSCNASLITSSPPEWCKNFEHKIAANAAHVQRQMKTHRRKKERN